MRGPASKLCLLAQSAARAPRLYVQCLKPLTSSAPDIFHRPRLTKDANRDLELYATIAFPDEEKLEQKFNWDPKNTLDRDSENMYIYKHVHKRLHDKYAFLNNKKKELPIHGQVAELVSLSEIGEDQSIARQRKLYLDIKDGLKGLNQMELVCILASIRDKNTLVIRSIKRYIDVELRWLLKQNFRTRLMDIDLWLYISDIYYESKLRSCSTHVLLNYLSSDIGTYLSDQQLIHTLFLVILKRQQDGLLARHESRLREFVPTAHFDQVAIICMAFFKTKTVITDQILLARLISRTRECLKSIDPDQPAFVSVLKALRYSAREGNLHVQEGISALCKDITKKEHEGLVYASCYNSTHTLKLFDSYRIYDANFFESFWKHLFRDTDSFRVKDVQYALSSLTNVGNHFQRVNDKKMKDLRTLALKLVKKDLRDSSQHQNYHLLPIGRAMATFGFYEDMFLDYLVKCLNDDEFYEHAKSVLEFEKSALMIMQGASIEAGRSLAIKQEVKQKLISGLNFKIFLSGPVKKSSLFELQRILQKPKPSCYDWASHMGRVAASLSSCKEFSGPDYEFNFQLTLPHQNYTDLVISYRAKNPGSYDTSDLSFKRVPEGERHIIIMGSKSWDYFYKENRLHGTRPFVMRLLKKIGYDVILVRSDIEIDTSSLVRRIQDSLHCSEREDRRASIDSLPAYGSSRIN